jgi:hypothetical protein
MCSLPPLDAVTEEGFTFGIVSLVHDPKYLNYDSLFQYIPGMSSVKLTVSES